MNNTKLKLLIIISIFFTFCLLSANELYNSEIHIYRVMETDSLVKFCESNPDSPVPYVELGDRYLRKKEYKKAETMFLKAKAINPEFRFAYEGLGQIYIEWKRYDVAIACFEKAIQKKSLHFMAYYYLATTYKEHLNNKDKAIEVLQTFENNLLKYGRKDYQRKVWYYGRLRSIYKRIYEPELADSMQVKSSRLVPSTPDDFKIQADMLNRMRKYDQVEDNYEKLLNQNGYKFEWYRGLYYSYRNQNRADADIQELLREFIDQMEKQPLENKSMMEICELHSFCMDYNVDFDLKERLSREVDRIVIYLNNLPDSVIAKTRSTKYIIFPEPTDVIPILDPGTLKITSPGQAEWMLYNPVTKIKNPELKDWYIRKLLMIKPKTSSILKEITSLHLRYSDTKTAKEFFEYALSFSTNPALDYFGLSIKTSYKYPLYTIELLKRSVEANPAFFKAVMNLYEDYFELGDYANAEKVIVDYLNLPSDAFDYLDTLKIKPYYYEKEFYTKIVLHYELTRLYNCFYPGNEKKARKNVKRMYKYFRKLKKDDIPVQLYLYMARSYRFINDFKRAEKIYREAIKYKTHYSFPETELEDMKENGNTNIKDKSAISDIKGRVRWVRRTY